MQQDRMQNAKVPQDRQKQPVQQKQSAQQQQNSKQPNQQKQQVRPNQQNQPKQAMQPRQTQQRPQQPQQTPQAQQLKPQVQPRLQQAQQPAQPKAQPQVRAGAEENVVFVGQKPSMAYVLAVMTQFNSGIGEIHVKARGKSIARAVDVAEIVRRKFLSSLRVKSIRIGTEEHEVEGKGNVPVSLIEIVLCK